MSVELATPPNPAPWHGKARKSYAAFFNLLKTNPGEWVSIGLDDITGDTPERKQRAIASNATSRKLRIQTSRQEGRLYARLITAEELG